jgi:hypothetical protein
MSINANTLRSMLHNQVEQSHTNDLVHSIMNGQDDSVSQWGGSESGIDKVLFEEFKSQVHMWMELDTVIKRLQMAIKDKKKAQGKLTESIIEFMKQNNIEDINTKAGVVRYKKSVVKAGISQKDIKQRLSEYFANDNKALDAVNRVFEDRAKVEKVTLKRLRI